MAAVSPVQIFKVGGSVIGVGMLGIAGYAVFRNNITIFKRTDRVELRNKIKNLGLFQQNGVDEEAYVAVVERLMDFSKGELDKVSAETAIEAAKFHLAIQAQLNQAQLQKEQAETQARLQKEQAEKQAKEHHDEVVEQAAEATKQTEAWSTVATKAVYAVGITSMAYVIKEGYKIYSGR